MSRWYNFLYRFGITPWEENSTEGAVAAQVSALLDREEEGREPLYGPALDLGCGSGIWSVVLAQRGWKVTGIDIVPRAIVQARERAAAADVAVQFLEGDVASLREAGVEPGFRFILDFECFNHLNSAQRRAVGQEVSAVAAPNATMLMLVWAPGRRGVLPPGASRDEIEAAFPGWTVVNEDAFAARSTLPFWLKRTDLRFYRLRRAAHR